MNAKDSFYVVSLVDVDVDVGFKNRKGKKKLIITLGRYNNNVESRLCFLSRVDDLLLPCWSMNYAGRKSFGIGVGVKCLVMMRNLLYFGTFLI
jgi:hypothetical protein